MIYLGVQCMYFCAKPLQNQCILELVHYTKQTVYLESYFDLNTLKMIVKIKFVVNFVKLDLIRTFNSNNTLHQLMGNETSLAQKRQIEQSFYTFLEIVYLEVIKELKKQCILEIFVPKPKQCICENSVPWGCVPWGLAVDICVTEEPCYERTPCTILYKVGHNVRRVGGLEICDSPILHLDTLKGLLSKYLIQIVLKFQVFQQIFRKKHQFAS